MTTTIAWLRCKSSCAAIGGAAGDDYTATAADIGSQLRVDVTGTVGSSSITASSRVTAKIEGIAPANVTLPAISPAGVPGIGDTITATDGAWTTMPPTTFTYQWQRCTPPGTASCSDVPGATASTYRTVVADADFTLRVRVTAHHVTAAATAVSGVTQTVTGAGPTSAVMQTITGQAVRGATLTADNGTFTGPGLITTTGQWQRCDGTGASCVDIAGATASTYLLGMPDVGATVVYRVTATNPWGTASRSSAATAVIIEPDPANTTLPTVTGSLYDGGTASASTGAWAGLSPFAFTYEWQRCDASGGSCVAIIGATSQAYSVGSLDVAGTLRVVVAATNAVHPATDITATSAASAMIGASPSPALVTVPTITGAAQDGGTLTWHAGTYTGQLPMTMVRQWQRCNGAGASCVDIGGATATTFTLAASDIGSTIRVREQATNSFGSAGFAASVVTSLVAAVPPSNSSAPTVTGTTTDGATLTATNGVWSGSPTMTYTYQWRRCDAGGAACTDVGTGASTYALAAADVSGTMRVVVTALNGAGSGAPATSAATSVIAAAPPVVGSPLPSITGVVVRNNVLSTTTGSFTGTQPFTYTYQWQRCNAAGAACANVAGATSASYTLVPADVGQTMRSRVTANSTLLTASATATSAQTTVVADALVAPSETTPVELSGEALQHITLSVVPATFAGTAPITHAYQWQRCDSLGMSCSDVANTSDATGATWLLDDADIGFTMRVVDTGTNSAGTASSTSGATGVVAATVPALNTAAPSIAGQLEEGAVISADNGTWDGSPEPTFTVAWHRCNVDGSACAPIAGATDASYSLVGADVGFAIKVHVAGSNAFGSDSASSAVSSEVAPARRPVNSGSLPSISTVAPSGVPETTQALSAADGVWSGTEAVHAYRWLRCDSVGDACVPISGATETTYTLLHPADAGDTFRVEVTLTNVAGTDTATSPATLVVIAGTPPSPIDVPDVARDGNGTIDLVTAPAWSGTEALTFEYEWLMCTDPADDAQCTTHVPRGGSSAFSMTSADFQDVPSWLRLRVWASNALAPAGVASELSNAMSVPTWCDGCPGDCLCDSVTPPTITGEAIYPGTLSGDPGTWTSVLPLTMLNQWFRCDVDGDACVAIPGAIDSTYATVPADIGTTIRFSVIASGEFGNSAPETSDQTAVVLEATPPVNTVLPIVTGADATIGTSLVVDDGAWTGLPSTFTYGYQWERCDVDGANCVDIADAIGNSYTLDQGDLGLMVRARVTATNVAGFATAESDAYPSLGEVVIQADDPVAPASTEVLITNATDPASAPYEGHTLSVAVGDWGGTAPVEFAYQWQLCDAWGSACDDLVGENAASHVITHDEIGGTFRVEVVGSNPSLNVDTVTSDSYPESPGVALAAVQPFLDGGGSPITIDDDPERTKPSDAAAGTWLGTQPMNVTSQWQRCADLTPASCEDITGETSTSYTPTAVDVNEEGLPYHLRLVVTATNVAGTTVAPGPISANPVLPGAAPDNTAAPSIVGTLVVGEMLGADPGTWTGTGEVLFTYQWRRCDAVGADCHDVLGATAETYVSTAEDDGLTLVVEVIGHNLVGVSDAVSSAPVGPIAP